MALPSTSVLSIIVGGSDTANGPVFDPSNASMATDWSVASANTSSPVVTSASYTFVASDVGAWWFNKSGTNGIPGWYQIVSVSAGAATLSAAIGAAVLTNFTLNTTVGCGTSSSLTSQTGTVNYSWGASARTTLTAATAAGSGSTITDSAIGKNWVGNGVMLTGGTNVTAGLYMVNSTSGTTATLDRACTTGATSNAAGGMGGAYASPGAAAAASASGHRVLQKSGTYTLTTSTAGAGGPVSLSGKSGLEWIGYGTIPGDMGTAPVISAGAIASIVVFEFGGSSGNSRCSVNIKVDGNSQTSITGFSSAANLAENCIAANCTTAGFSGLSTSNCTATGCLVGFGAIVSASGCFTKSCTTGFSLTSGSHVNDSVASGGTTGFKLDGAGFQGTVVKNCVAYNTSGAAISEGTGSRYNSIINFIAVSCGAVSLVSRTLIRRFFTYNTTASFGTNLVLDGSTTLSANPLTDPANDDFTPNNTAGGGAVVRGLSRAFANTATSTYRDAGALQHREVAGGATQLVGSGLVG